METNMIMSDEKLKRAYEEWRRTGNVLNVIAKKHSVPVMKLSGYIGLMLLQQTEQKVKNDKGRV